MISASEDCSEDNNDKYVDDNNKYNEKQQY